MLQNELNVRIVKGRVKGRDESVNVWYQGLLNEVASAFEFVKLGLAAITGTPKVCILSWFLNIQLYRYARLIMQTRSSYRYMWASLFQV